uniref:ATP-dependent DNA helicase n=1 Tax=Lactuca sativa TaxID=4236 RepID=A0A9R1VRD8_LACSA|nr:hypothetical protein LSAT_V11C400225350 [Lactuca sativa]
MNIEWCSQVGSIKYLFKINNIKKITTVMKLLSFTIVVIFLLTRHVGYFLGMPLIIEHHLLKGCRFTLKTNNMLFLNHTDYGQEEKQRQTHLAELITCLLSLVMFLRILLNKVKCPTCYEDIRTVNRTIYDSYKDACYTLVLLDDDREYKSSIHETHHWATASFRRPLFVMLITSNSLSEPHHVFKETYNCHSGDVVHVCEEEIDVIALKLTGSNFPPYKSLLSHELSLKQIPKMPFPNHKYIQDSSNMLIQDEQNYDLPTLEVEHQEHHSKLNVEQKTFMIQLSMRLTTKKVVSFSCMTLSAAIRFKGEIVIKIASSGIAALFPSGGRTTHSIFHLPINLNEDSFCSITLGNDVATVLNKARLIIWDEVVLMHHHCFEAFDRTFRDVILSSNKNKLFGGKTIVSYPNNDFKETKSFAEWILKIGEGTISGPNDGEVEVEFPKDFIVPSIGDHIHSIVSTLYSSFQNHLDDPSYFQDKTILVPTNEEVGAINDYMLELMKDEGKMYRSSDSVL